MVTVRLSRSRETATDREGVRVFILGLTSQQGSDMWTCKRKSHGISMWMSEGIGVSWEPGGEMLE